MLVQRSVGQPGQWEDEQGRQLLPVPPPRKDRPSTARRGGRPIPQQSLTLCSVEGGGKFGSFGGRIHEGSRITATVEAAELEVYCEGEDEVLYSYNLQGVGSALERPAPVLEEPLPTLWSGGSSPSSGGSGGLRCLHALNDKVLRDAQEMENRKTNLRSKTSTLQENVMYYHLKHHEALINRIPLLSRDILSPEEQFAVINRLSTVFIKSGTYICQEGDTGDSIYIICSGACQVLRNVNDVEIIDKDGDGQVTREEAIAGGIAGEAFDAADKEKKGWLSTEDFESFKKLGEVVLGTLQRGSFFGERAVFCGEPRNASVRAVGPVQVIMSTADDIREALSGARFEELRQMAHVQIVKGIPGFIACTNLQQLRLARLFTGQVWACGQAIGMQGEICRRMYTIEAGEATLVHSLGQPINRRLHDTDASGEVLRSRQQVGLCSLFLAAPLPVTIIARSALVRVLSLGYDGLWAACKDEEENSGELSVATADEMLDTMRKSVRLHLMRMWDPLAKLPQDMLEKVMGRSTLIELAHCASIIKVGDTQDSVYFLEEGCIIAERKATNTNDGSHQEHSRPGAFFGVEKWNDPYSQAQQTLVAGQRSLVLRVPKTALREVLAGREKQPLTDSRKTALRAGLGAEPRR